MERKLATVLFVDLVDSTGLVTGADPEVVRRRVQNFFDRVSHCVITHGGIVEKFAGDAVMAAFGIPQAHEDDAERAVRAGLAILDAVEELKLEARVGVESGEIVTEDGEATFATGEAVNLAARLQQAADPGQLVLGPGAHRLTLGRIEVEDLGPVELKGIAEKPYGLILCVGPTGAGKTTSLHAVLGHINTPGRKIWTAEDPVEITQDGLRQVQVRPKIGYTFAAAMRAMLRADPDVIMVGEMRDAETAGLAVEASLTGHLVLSTLHTNSAVETIVRLLDLGLNSFNFADALLGVLAQRLVKRLCLDCRQPYHPERHEWNELALAFGVEELEAQGYRYTEDLELFQSKGCETCDGKGYRDRIAIHELLVATPAIKRRMQKGARVAKVVARAKHEGMTTLVQDGILKALAGITDFRQVKAAAIR